MINLELQKYFCNGFLEEIKKEINNNFNLEYEKINNHIKDCLYCKDGMKEITKIALSQISFVDLMKITKK